MSVSDICVSDIEYKSECSGENWETGGEAETGRRQV